MIFPLLLNTLSLIIELISLNNLPVKLFVLIIIKFQFGVFPFSLTSLFISLAILLLIFPLILFFFSSFSLVLLIISSILTFLALILWLLTLFPLYFKFFKRTNLSVAIFFLNLSLILPARILIKKLRTKGSTSVFFKTPGLKIAS